MDSRAILKSDIGRVEGVSVEHSGTTGMLGNLYQSVTPPWGCCDFIPPPP